MTRRNRIVVVTVWALSLLAVAEWTARAQAPQTLPGKEVRFLPGTGKPGTPHGTLVANFSGQWLPVTLDSAPLPDPNAVVPR